MAEDNFDRMKDVIKVQFVKDCKASGRAYTYYTPEAVEVGDLVDVETNHGVTQAVVSQIHVPQAEIARFGDKAKAIIGRTACRCEDCELLHPWPDGSCLCSANPGKIPVCGGLPTDYYLWCLGCYFQKRENASESPACAGAEGQQTLSMPTPTATPWDHA